MFNVYYFRRAVQNFETLVCVVEICPQTIAHSLFLVHASVTHPAERSACISVLKTARQSRTFQHDLPTKKMRATSDKSSIFRIQIAQQYHRLNDVRITA